MLRVDTPHHKGDNIILLTNSFAYSMATMGKMSILGYFRLYCSCFSTMLSLSHTNLHVKGGLHPYPGVAETLVAKVLH